MRNYINYNFIKKKIKTLWEKQKIEKEENILIDDQKINKPENDIKIEPAIEKLKIDPVEQILQSSLGKYINEFLNLIDNEIKCFYKFCNKLEKNLYIDINSHLYMEDNYK